jgi:hemoglobin-like flavoprotein
MSQEPLITRAELRKRRQQADHELSEQQKQMIKESENEQHRREKEIDRFYRKEYKKKQPIKKTRARENQKSRQMNTFLGKAIALVAVLIILVYLAIIYL